MRTEKNRNLTATAENSNETSEHAAQSNRGRGWHGNSQGHAAAGKKGGQKVARDREHMAEIGKKGGEAVSRNREHMAEIGRKGGKARGKPEAQQKRASS